MLDFPVSDSDEKIDVSELTKEQVKQMVIDALPTDKRELTILLNGSDKVVETPIVAYRKEDGQMESFSQSIFDAVDGSLLQTKTDTYTYYDNEERNIDEIHTVIVDGQGNEIENKTIKHFTDGRQPEVTHG